MPFDNEVETDANDTQVTESSDQSQDTSQETAEPNATGEQPAATPKDESNVPFHEHPRFKELVEQKNQWSTQAKQYEQQMQQLQRQIQALQQPKAPAAPSEKDQLIERLKGIDPQFAKYISELDGRSAKLDQFEQWQRQVESERVRTQAVSTLNELHTANKVPEQFRDLINSQIELAAMRDPNIGLHNLKEVYANVHANFNKMMENFRRAERESYVKDKQASSVAPTSQPRGKAVSTQQKVEWSKNPQEARAQLEKRILDNLRANRKNNAL